MEEGPLRGREVILHLGRSRLALLGLACTGHSGHGTSDGARNGGCCHGRGFGCGDLLDRRGNVNNKFRKTIIDQVVQPVVRAECPHMWADGIKFHVNPTGRFVIGGPHGDTGLTGRKIIVDSYGGRGAHGGGAFSGKDPSKVDRSATYMARHIAKNVVAARLADICEVQLAYAIGVAEPVSVLINTEGTACVDEGKLEKLVRDHFPLTPAAIIDYLKLKRPIYRETAAHGHFGRNGPGFTWEKTNVAKDLRRAIASAGSKRGEPAKIAAACR